MPMTEFDAADGHVRADDATSTPAAAGEKTCTACNETKPFTEFSANASNADGLQRHCKACMRDMKARAKARQEEGGGDEFATLSLDAILPSLTNPRTVFDDAKLAELAESIAASGVHQPILVRPLPANRLDETSRKLGRTQRETHEIVSGERRWRSSKIAGKATIPALVRRLTDAQVLEIQIVENLQRDDLSELEEAEGYHRLIEQTGIAKEDVGAKIGKSRSYVYQRLKLLDLCPAGREALRRGEIDASKAQRIARIPDDKLQIKALTEATRKDHRGEPLLSVKAFQTWLQNNVMLRLEGARFDITDVTLRDGAGGCAECPKRTGANPDLFADVDGPDICIDPACFHDKEQTHDERVIEKAKAEGRKVIDAGKAEKIYQPYDSQQPFKGYFALDTYPSHQLGVDGATLRKALGKHCPPAVLVTHPTDGQLMEVLPVDQVRKVIATHGLKRKDKAARKEAAKQKKLPIEERREFSLRYQEAALKRADAHFKNWTGGVPAALLRAFLLHTFNAADEGPFGPALDLGTEFHTADAEQRLLTLPDEAMPEVFIRWMLHDTESGYIGAWSNGAQTVTEPRHPTWEIFHMAGVDVAEIQAETKRAMESEERAAELEAQEKAAAKGGKAPRATAPPAARAGSGGAGKPRGKARTSSTEAREGIAAAMQAADEDTDRAPDGAGQEAPAAPTAGGPVAQVSDWVVIRRPGWWADGRKGQVMQVRSSGRALVRLDGPDAEEIYTPVEWLTIVVATAAWPFPKRAD